MTGGGPGSHILCVLTRIARDTNETELLEIAHHDDDGSLIIHARLLPKQALSFCKL